MRIPLKLPLTALLSVSLAVFTGQARAQDSSSYDYAPPADTSYEPATSYDYEPPPATVYEPETSYDYTPPAPAPAPDSGDTSTDPYWDYFSCFSFTGDHDYCIALYPGGDTTISDGYYYDLSSCISVVGDEAYCEALYPNECTLSSATGAPASPCSGSPNEIGD